MARFRVLIVENDPVAVDNLRKLIARAVPEAEIIAVCTVAEAEEAIEEALRDKTLFDLAILDFKLPKRSINETDEVDVATCDLLTRTMPGVIIGHVTGWADDPAVREHIETKHASEQTKGFVLSK